MLTARGLFQEIHHDDEAFRLFCSIAMNGESQGGWENGRIAALVSDPQLAPKIARHGADEDKHGRIFRGLMHNRGLEPVQVPEDTDYTMLLEQQGIGLAHSRLRRDEPLDHRDITVYLTHSRVTEQRASEQMRLLRKAFAGNPQMDRAVRQISADEDRHLAYCHEELLRLSAQGHAREIARTLHETAQAEIRVYRDVSIAVMTHMARILGWPKAKLAVLSLGINGVYTYERAGGRRRMTTLRPPAIRNALGGGPVVRDAPSPGV
ncbi:MAG TPA: ferritin-like domain-containing protein [Actinospica sp.]|nr:ferritin-like domain-containing protein [Actinospica sp.]